MSFPKLFNLKISLIISLTLILTLTNCFDRVKVKEFCADYNYTEAIDKYTIKENGVITGYDPVLQEETSSSVKIYDNKEIYYRLFKR